MGNDGINDQSTTPGSQLIVAGESIYNNTGDGVFLGSPSGVAGSAVLDGDFLDSNRCGLIVSGVGPGAGPRGTGTATAAQGATATSYDTSITNNTGTGVYSGGAPAQNVISTDLITGNGTGLGTAGGGTIVPVGANNVVFANATDGAPASSHTTGAVGPTGLAGANGGTAPTAPTGRRARPARSSSRDLQERDHVREEEDQGQDQEGQEDRAEVHGQARDRPGQVHRRRQDRQRYAISRWPRLRDGNGVDAEDRDRGDSQAPARPIPRGRYTLRLSQGRAILSWRTVIAS